MSWKLDAVNFEVVVPVITFVSYASDPQLECFFRLTSTMISTSERALASRDTFTIWKA